MKLHAAVPVVTVLALVVAAQATTRYVAPGGPTVAPYDSWAKASSNIQVAIDACVDGDTVMVAEGTYDTGGRAPGGLGYNTVNRVLIDRGILVISSNGPANTIIVGKGPVGPGAVRCAYVSSNGVLSGFTLRGGAVLGSGGGGVLTDVRGGGALIDARGVLTNCAVQGCEAERGGGIALYWATALCVDCVATSNRCGGSGGGINAYLGTVIGCTVSNNAAREGGGVALRPPQTYASYLRDSYVVNNHAQGTFGFGGGVYCEGDGVISNCTLRANRADAHGGGAYLYTDGLLLNSFVRDNRALRGGGVYSDRGERMYNCAVFGNVCSNEGGGVFCKNTEFDTYNATIVSNRAIGRAGGVYSEAYNDFHNTIIYHNTAPSDPNLDYIEGAIGTMFYNCCVTPAPASGDETGTLTADPQLVDLAGFNLRLDGGSPCINAGRNDSGYVEPDLAGTSRVINTVIDIGAYEYTGMVHSTGAPVISQVAPPDWTISPTTVVDMTITVVDDGGVSNVTVDGAPAIYDSGDDWTFSTVIASGTNLREIIACDFDALCATARVHYVYTNQVDAPTIDSITPPDLYVAGLCPVTMTIVAYDNIGVSNVTVNGAPAEQVSTDTWTYTVSLGPGTNTYVVRAYDTAMNMAQATVRYISALPAVGPNTLCVAPFGSSTPPYTSWETAATVIQDAVDAAAAGKRVLVAPGKYETGESSPGSALSNRVTVTKAVLVESLCGPEVTHIVGRGPRSADGLRCVYLDNGAVLAGFTLSNGHTWSTGDAFLSAGGGAFLQYDTVLSNCIVTMCAANDGGGVYAGADSTLTGCRVVTNTAQFKGGGVYCIAGSVVTNTTITRNSARPLGSEQVGGIYCAGGGRIVYCEISFNTRAGGSGSVGGALLHEGSLMDRCVIRDNNWVGVLCERSTVANTLCYENGWYGLWVRTGARAVNCTVVRNGDGLYAQGGLNTGDTVFIQNTIMYQNSGQNTSGQGLREYTYCCATPALPPAVSEGCIDDDPRFLNSAGGDFRLRDTSPCIDMGTNGLTYGDWDLEGNPRILDGVVDMGAYEWVPEPGAALAATVFALLVAARSRKLGG